MLKMTQKARNAAKKLAVTYSAYCRASDDSDALGVNVWGEMLIDAQELTGVELVAPKMIQQRIKDTAAVAAISAAAAA